MRLRRKIKSLNDAIESLDQTLRKAKGNPLLALSKLTPTELSFVREEIAACVTSRIYYLENYHCIQTEQGELKGMYPLYTHQHMIEEAIQKERARTGQCKIIVLKPRQSGGTEFANGVMCHCTFFTPQAYTLCVAQSAETAAHVQRKVNIAWDFLPWWLRPERMYHSKGEYLEFQRKDEYERQLNPGLGSVFVTTHAERSAGVAIGKTIRFFHGTEVSRWGSGEIYTADIEPSMNARDTLAIMESASLDDTGFFRALWEESVADPDPDWVPVFLPVYRAPKFSLPLKLGQKFVRTDVEQASYDRVLREENFRISDEFFNWRRRRVLASIKRTGGPHAHYAAYPMTPKEAFQSSGQGAFPRHKLDYQEQKNVRAPAWHGEILFQGMHTVPRTALVEVRPGQTLPAREHENRLWVWEEPKPSEFYYIGVDTALGNGGDYSAAVIWKAGRGNLPDEQVAEWHGWIAPTEWAKTVHALGTWYGKPEIAVEYMQQGITTADYLLNQLEYPNVYRPRHHDRAKLTLAPYMHWQTSYKTKTMIITTFTEALLEDTVIIHSQLLLDQARKLRVSSISDAGRVSYSGLDSPDDDIMSGMIGLHCLRETMPELRSPSASGDGSSSLARGARAAAGGVVYAIHDEWTRMRLQTRDLQRAQDIVKVNPGWMIKQLVVSRANSAYSLIHHGHGAENELYRQGVDSKEILPAMVAAYSARGAVAKEESDAPEFNAIEAGGDWTQAE